MEILVVTNSCSTKKYDEVCRMRKKAIVDPQQKFFHLMIQGLASIDGVNVKSLSALPVSASSVERKLFSLEDDNSEEGISYKYLPFINGKILRYITLYMAAKKYVKRWCKNRGEKEAAIIVDPLIPVIAIPTRIIGQKKGIKVSAVVTDIPSLTTNMKGRKQSLIKRAFLLLYQKIADSDLQSYDSYVPLTISINDVVNKEGKPFVVVEGFADSRDTSISNNHKRYLMYAGGIYEKYGLNNLVEAFLELNRNDIELYIFGEGPYVQELMKIQKENPTIKYMGCVSSQEVVQYEKEALLLINPRPTNEEFAKYSFPSKTMEYMLSGTPVVSTKLPGIPKEYFDHIYTFDGDDKEHMTSTLLHLVNKPEEELFEFGRKAHDFVIRYKNNNIMARNIYMLLIENIQSGEFSGKENR